MNERFSTAATNLTMKRSKFIEEIPVYQHAFHGDLMIDLIFEMLPGDNLKVKLHDYTRMSVPIAPLMGNIRKHFAAFMCPKRILSNKTKNFYGEAETFGIATKVNEPRFGFVYDEDYSAARPVYPITYDFIIGQNLPILQEDFGVNPMRCIGTFMNVVGQDYYGNAWDDYTSGDMCTPLNVLPLFGFLKIYNEHFRDQNYCLPYMWDMDLEGDYGVTGSTPADAPAFLGDSSIGYYSALPKVRKDNDMFVTFLPWAQKGDPVELPIGDSAPIYAIANKDITHDTEVSIFTDKDALAGEKVNFTAETLNTELAGSSIYADLTSATAVTISQLLYAVAYQDFLQRLCKFGSKYGDYIKAIFGVTTDDATQDIPEFIGYRSMLLNIDTVVQTTDHQNDEDNGLGQLGGYSATRFDDNDGYYIDYACKEPGYVYLLSYFKHERVYATSIDDIFLKHELLDYYQTPFANISDTPYPRALIYFDGYRPEDEKTFGFNEPFIGYRTHVARCKGFLNPSLPGSLATWVLADVPDYYPELGQEFVEEDRNAIARCLTSGEMGPDYLCSTNYLCEWTRVMPLYSTGRIGTF